MSSVIRAALRRAPARRARTAVASRGGAAPAGTNHESRDGVYRRPLEPEDSRDLGIHSELVIPDAAGPEPILDIDTTTDRRIALASLIGMLCVMTGVGLTAGYFHSKRRPLAEPREHVNDNLASELGGTVNVNLASPGARQYAGVLERAQR